MASAPAVAAGGIIGCCGGGRPRRAAACLEHLLEALDPDGGELRLHTPHVRLVLLAELHAWQRLGWKLASYGRRKKEWGH